ncbi:MAG: oligosaccharide flippase family protein [Gammaproteobacteria bacterium]|nr:oligosaccharide flippase family protein [Gammaproteobacteria bacterium]
MTGATTTVGICAPRRAPLAQNVAAMYALQIANYLIPLVTLPYLIRVLGAEQYGVMAMAYAVVFFMVLFVDAGFNTLATRRLSRPGIRATQINEIFVATQLVKLGQCGAMFLLLCALSAVVPQIGKATAVYFATFPIVLGSLLFPTWLFQGLQIMHFTAACSVGGRLLATVGIFVLVKDAGDVVTAALLQASATAISGLLALPILFGRVRLRLTVPRRRLRARIRRTLADARPLAPAEYLTDAVGNSGVFILGFFASDAAVGVYAAIEKVARAGAGLFQPLTKALFPALAGHWISGAADAERFCRSWTQRILSLAIVLGIAMSVVAPTALEILFGDGWAEHAALLRVLAAWIAASVAATVLGQFWLLARGARSIYSRCLVTAGVFQLLVALVGAGLYGAQGLVVAAVIAELARLLLYCVAARRAQGGASACAC